MPSRTEADLLAGIVARPDELDRWLVLADWLEDQGDPRAELARLRYLLHVELDHPEADTRRARQLALLEAGLAPVVPTWTNALGMRFALVLPGSFLMGSPASEWGRYDDEVLHAATLTEPFYLGVFPITVGEFDKFVQATTYTTEAEKENDSITWREPGFAQNSRHPVVCVSWNDAQAMVVWLNQVEGDTDLVYALPTEAQWEYACRAGSTKAYFWGDDPNQLGGQGWFSDNSGDKTHPVKSKKPNPWGLHQMHGNVWEWCADWYGSYPSVAVEDPPGPSSGSSHVCRGGGWDRGARDCRAAFRGFSAPADEYNLPALGLRLARVPVRLQVKQVGSSG